MADFKEVKARVSFADAIRRLELKLKQSGNEWRGACPICDGSERSLTISMEKGFRCWTSNAKGSVIDLVAHIRDIPLKEAADWLTPQQPTKPESERVQEPPQKPQTLLFDRAKYQATLDRGHELLKDVAPEVTLRADLGVSGKGTHRGLINVPLYDKDTGDFICYAGVPSIQLPKNIK